VLFLNQEREKFESGVLDLAHAFVDLAAGDASARFPRLAHFALAERALDPVRPDLDSRGEVADVGLLQ